MTDAAAIPPQLSPTPSPQTRDGEAQHSHLFPRHFCFETHIPLAPNAICAQYSHLRSHHRRLKTPLPHPKCEMAGLLNTGPDSDAYTRSVLVPVDSVLPSHQV